jgi:3-oxoacyl-[acyl-carrier-protein] synthase II
VIGVMNTHVVVTGVGLVSPFGTSLADVTGRFAAGDRGALPHGGVAADAQGSVIALDDLPEERRSHVGRLDRFCRLLLVASHRAVSAAELRIDADNCTRIGLSFGTGFGCVLTNAEYDAKMVTAGPGAASPRLFAYTVSSAAAGEVSIALGIKGPNVTAHMGFAAGLGAVGYGLDLIQLGKADVVLAAGADALGPPIVQALEDMRLLKGPQHTRPFRDATPGVHPAEAAVVMVLESPEHARRRGAPLLAKIEGYAAGFEPTATRPDRQTDGVTATLRRALSRCGRDPDRVTAVLASAHGTPLDALERLAIAEAFGASAPLLLAPKSVFGETFGASGTVALALGIGILDMEALGAHAGAVPDVTDVAEVAFGIDGRAWSWADAARRLRAAEAVLVSSLCYTGNVVALVAARADDLDRRPARNDQR